MFTINTKASGNFKVYIPDNDGNLNLVADADNLITDGGLNGIATKTWAESFQMALAGSGSTPATNADTALDVLELSTSVQPAEPASYTMATYSAVGGATYILGKTFKLTNTTGVSKTIRELGTSSGSGGTLFSRVNLPTSFTLADGKFAYIVYELRLSTGVSTTRQTFQVSTDGSTGFLLPANCDLGIFNCPFATLTSGGVVTNNTFGSGHALFEPSNTTYNLYKLNAAAPVGYFNTKRNFYEIDSNLAAASNTAPGSPAYSNYSSIVGGSVLIPESTYVANSFKKTYHLIVSPTTPPPATPESIYGFALSNCSTPTTIPNVGLHCIFPSAWSRPVNSFFKIYFEQNWSR